MEKYERTSGKKAGARAILHRYDGNRAKIEIVLSVDDAQRILGMAVDKGGVCPVQLTLDGIQIAAEAVGARIDSLDEKGRRIGGTGVIEFGSLKRT